MSVFRFPVGKINPSRLSKLRTALIKEWITMALGMSAKEISGIGFN